MTVLSITTNAPLVSNKLKALFADIPGISERKMNAVGERIISRLNGWTGKASTSPVNWDSIKQRRAYFATNGFGRGIPTKRTGDFSHRWKLEKLTNGVRITSTAANVQYLEGDAYGLHQSRIHQGRWPLYRDVADSEIAKLPQEVQDEIKLAGKRAGVDVT